MKKRAIISKGTIAVIIITALILFYLSLNTTNVTSSINDNTTSEPSNLALTPHDPISITSDLGFTVFPGSGTEENPYVIEGFSITTTEDYGIYITDTTKYFTVRNCYVDARAHGISISTVADGTATVIINTCSNNEYYGIFLYASGSSTVANNTCTNNINGILISSSGSSTVANNTCSNNNSGINLRASGNSTVLNNTCSNNRNWGIYLSQSGSSTVANNTCTSKRYSSLGIYIFSSGNSTVANNTCCNNNVYGIKLLYSNSCLITYNLLQENADYGIYLSYYSDYNIIHHNTFVDNNLGGSSQACDEVKSNKWYDPETKEGNYWSNLGSKCTYNIEGKAHSRDLYPLNRAQSCPNPITMTILSIVLPLLVSVAILAFVVPKYVIPYTRNTIIPYLRRRRTKRQDRDAERQNRIAKLLSCPNCGEKIKLSVIFCENCGTTLPEKKLRVLDSKTSRIIVKVYLSLLFLSTAIVPWVIEPGDPGWGLFLFAIFGLLSTFVPLTIILAIIITTILFRSKIARMKLWKKVVLLITLIVLILAVIWAPFGIWTTIL